VRVACIEQQTLVDLVAGTLPAQDAEAARTHLGGCPACQARLIEAQAALAKGADGTATVELGQFPLRDPLLAAYLRKGENVGRFVVLRQLGEGGMGIVYAAYDPELDRKVALKLLQVTAVASASPSQGHARLVREAQAMARLSHPNVSAVYDVGMFGDRVFLAMELIEGQNLRQWLKAERRGWREVLALVTEAGRGLAAAHAAGLVHRDVKPDNILVSEDGHAKVTDFGLARAAGDRTADPALPESVSPEDPLVTPLTVEGLVLGTPGYMAPEQLKAGESDARTDQFSFCVTAYEALYGERPFGKEERTLLAAGQTAMPRPAPQEARVPSWLRAVLQRGLSTAPDQRYPSVDALLRELEQTPRRRARARWATATLAVIAGAGVALALGRGHTADPCAQPRRQLAGVWDEARRNKAHTAFLASGTPFQDDAWRVSVRTMDAYAEEWLGLYGQVCPAAQRRRDASAAVPLLQLLCLNRRLDELRALGDVFTSADARVVRKAVEAASSLTPVKACSDLRALQSAVKPPADDATRAQVETADSRLAESKALMDSGDYAKALTLGQAVAEQASQLDYPPLRAAALTRVGWLQLMTGDLKPAGATLEEAELAADAAADDATAAEAGTDLIYLGYLERDFTLGHGWIRRAEAKIQRVGGNDRLEAQRLNWAGALVQSEGKLEEARPLFEQALALRTRVYGPEHPEVGKTLFNMAFLLEEQGRFDDAMPVEARALAVLEAALGREHPLTAHVLQLEADLLRSEGDAAKAVPLARRAVEVKERAMGAGHPFVAEAYWVLGDALHGVGQDDEALTDFHRARDAFSKLEGEAHPDVAQVLASESQLLHDQHQDPAAEELAQRCVDVYERTLGAQHPRLVKPLWILADIAASRGAFPEAQTYAERAVAVGEAAYGADGPLLSYPLLALGRSHLGQHAADRAVPVLERAMALEVSHPLPPEHVAATQLALAEALWASPLERSRARALATQAQALLAARAAGGTATAWLSSHPAP
jgi:tetratricopeptide (TPR) repeat protein